MVLGIQQQFLKEKTVKRALQKEYREDFLLGNEAIARGAIEANIGFVAGYPGTPSSERIERIN